MADQDEAELASIREEDEDSEAEDPTFECFEDEEEDDEDDLQKEESDSEYWETDSADLERSGSDSDEEIIKEDINETIEDEEDIDSKRKCDKYVKGFLEKIHACYGFQPVGFASS